MWLLKTEPSTYGYDDLEREGRATWDGVKNPVALANLRKMKEGDAVFIYHTGDEKAVVGTALVVRAAYPDPKAGDPRLVVVDLEPTGRLARPVTLAEMRKACAVFADSPLRPPAAAVRGAAHQGAVERARADRAASDGPPWSSLSTVATAEDAERIARALVERGVAACVNVVPGRGLVLPLEGQRRARRGACCS